MAGIDIRQAKYELHYCKGQYFRVKASKSGLLKRLVYPVPEVKSAGLGIHATVDLGGSLRLGPDDEYLRSRERDYSVDHGKRFAFYSSVKKFMPFLEEEDLSADISGIRPKLQGPGEDFRDFIIQEESARGLPGFINTIGIESPGLTASPAIARYVKELIKR
jgi:L-2-hydroxyglutarate oxidase LhgO